MEKMAQQMVEMQRYMDAQVKLVAEQREQEKRAAEQRDAERKEAERQREREHERAMERLRQEMHAAQQQTTMAIAVMQASIQQLTTQLAQLLGMGGPTALLHHKPTPWEQHGPSTPLDVHTNVSAAPVQPVTPPALTETPRATPPAAHPPTLNLQGLARITDAVRNNDAAVVGNYNQVTNLNQYGVGESRHEQRAAQAGGRAGHATARPPSSTTAVRPQRECTRFTAAE